MKIPRIRLSADEHALIKQLRKKGVASELVNQCDEAGLPLSNVKHFWYKSEKFSIFSKTDGLQLEDVFDSVDYFEFVLLHQAADISGPQPAVFIDGFASKL